MIRKNIGLRSRDGMGLERVLYGALILARDSALEEAAKVAETLPEPTTRLTDDEVRSFSSLEGACRATIAVTKDRTAAAIRTLKGQPKA